MKKRGSAIVEYIIPMALVGVVVGTGLFLFLKNDVLLTFAANSLGSDIYKSEGKIVIGENLPVNYKTTFNSSASSEMPTSVPNSISEGVIDFGTFQLSGVPSDFGTFVETAGASGGTDKLATLLMQVVDQLEQEGQSADSELVKKLAVTGHNVAAIEKNYESMVHSCHFELACVQANADQLHNKPEHFDDRYYDFNGYVKDISVANNRMRKNTLPQEFQQHINGNESAAIFVETYDTLMASSTITEAQKGVITELYWNIGTLSDHMEASMYMMWHGEVAYNGWDPLTGKNVNQTSDLPSDPLQIAAGYKYSNTTHLESALICAADNYKDTGTRCD